MAERTSSSLDKIIPAEVKADRFYDAIFNIARSANVQTVLEIGSSAGDGSTDAFVKGLRQNPHHPVLYCMEVSEPRHKALADRYANDHFVKAYRASSVPVSGFATEEQVTQFYQTARTNLNQYPLQQVLGWLKDDIGYVNAENIPRNGIEKIKLENNIQHFGIC